MLNDTHTISVYWEIDIMFNDTHTMRGKQKIVMILY